MSVNQNLNVQPKARTGVRQLATELLVQGYVSTQRDLLNRIIFSGANATAWHRISDAFLGIHREQWRQVIGEEGEEALRRLNGRTKARFEQLSRLFRQARVAQASRDRLVADLEALDSDTRAWQDHVGRVDACYQRYVAIGWLGLRHTIEAGIEPKEAIRAFGIVFEDAPSTHSTVALPTFPSPRPLAQVHPKPTAVMTKTSSMQTVGTAPTRSTANGLT